MAPRLGLGGGVTANPASGLFAAPNLLLDNYPNAHRAYSVRKLRTEYSGYAMQVREGSGMNYTNDIAFDDDGWVSLDSKIYNRSDSGTNGITLSSYLSYYSNPDLMLTTWYDQSGEGSNATQSTAAAQPKIHSGGSLITEGSPARTSVLFDGSTDYMTVSPVGLALGSITASAVIGRGSIPSYGPAWTLSFSSGVNFMHYMQSSEDQYWYGSGDVASHYPAATGQKLFSYTSGSGTDKQILYANGVASSEKGDSTATTSLYNDSYNGLGVLYNYSLFYSGEFQEFIVYDSDQSSNLSSIESDINTAFSIY